MVSQKYRWDFIGLSTDEKPTSETSEKVVNGSTYYCSDTSKLYVYCDGTWYERKALGGGGGGGTSDFNDLSNRPKYNGSDMTGSTNIPEVITYSDFTGTDGTAAGTAGLVPAPATTDAGKFLKADGTWDTAGGGGSDFKVLSSADYNYPVNNPTAVALWLLPPGVYIQPSPALNVYANNEGIISSYTAGTFIVGNTNEGKVKILAYGASGDSPAMLYSTNVADGSKNYVRHLIDETRIVDTLTSTSTELVLPVKTGKTLNDKIEGRIITNAGAPTTATVGTVGQLLEDTTNGKLYICTDTTGGTYTWEEVGAGGGSGPTVVQTTGTSTTDVMSQNAVTSMIFADPATQYKIKIGTGASSNEGTDAVEIGHSAQALGDYTVAVGAQAIAQTGAREVAIGYRAGANAPGSVAIGTGAATSKTGEVNIGSLASTAYGYNNSPYRLLTGLYDPQSAHDAATKGYVDPTTDSSAPTTATVGRLGQIQIDTTTATAYMCVAVDTVTPAYTWKQITG